MNPVHTSLIHKILEPQRKSNSKYPTLMLLHGRGANEDDLLGLAEYLDDRLLIVSARAPFPFALGGGFTWYEIEEVGKPEPKMFAESYRKLSQFIDDVVKGYPVDPSKLLLCGFSMGSVMSYSMALTRPQAVAGVAANSGYIAEDSGLNIEWTGVKGKPFFISHGMYDPVIPVAFARRAKELLEPRGAAITYREYDMGHQIIEDSLNDMMRWLTQQI
ncbi:MAG TPA: phospholipase [Bacteroidota bacterium]|jgi:phospholipase/carboxylesterase